MKAILLSRKFTKECEDYLKKKGIEIVDKDADVLLSILHDKKITRKDAKLRINFHIAPLPEYRGRFCVNFGILNEEKDWAVTAHHIDDSLDTGDIIKIMRFKINPKSETAYSLSQKSYKVMMRLFKEIVDDLCEGKEIPRIPQYDGRYYSRREFEEARIIRHIDDEETVDRKKRAFYYPPHAGAVTEEEAWEEQMVINGLAVME